MKRKTKILVKFIFIIFLLNLTKNSYSFEKINISKISKERLEGYLSGQFFSYVENNFISNSSGVFFFLSDDGDYSVIAFCPDFRVDRCDLNHIKFRTQYRCEKISNQKCRLIFKNNKLKQKKFQKYNRLDFKKFFLLKDSKSINKIKNYTSEIRARTFQEISGDDLYTN